jgi:hypothetical protein
MFIKNAKLLCLGVVLVYWKILELRSKTVFNRKLFYLKISELISDTGLGIKGTRWGAEVIIGGKIRSVFVMLDNRLASFRTCEYF